MLLRGEDKDRALVDADAKLGARLRRVVFAHAGTDRRIQPLYGELHQCVAMKKREAIGERENPLGTLADH